MLVTKRSYRRQNSAFFPCIPMKMHLFGFTFILFLIKMSDGDGFLYLPLQFCRLRSSCSCRLRSVGRANGRVEGCSIGLVGARTSPEKKEKAE